MARSILLTLLGYSLVIGAGISTGGPRRAVEQAPDAPGYEEEDTLFPFGHVLSY